MFKFEQKDSMRGREGVGGLIQHISIYKLGMFKEKFPSLLTNLNLDPICKIETDSLVHSYGL